MLRKNCLAGSNADFSFFNTVPDTECCKLACSNYTISMRIKLFFIWSVLLIIFSQSVDAQKVILLRKAGKNKNIFYKLGDKITIRTGDPEFTARGVITHIDDSVCTINNDYSFKYSKVNEVIRPRNFLLHSWRTLYLAAGVYAVGSVFNRAINSDDPIIDNTIPIVSGSFIVLGTTAYLFRYRHFKHGKGWTLKVLDFDIYKEKYEHEE